MNKTKRLLSVLLCVLMAISMFSTFTFAQTAGSDAGADAGVPTIDPLADNVLIYDSQLSINDDYYTLIWNDEQFDDLPRGTKAFRRFVEIGNYITDNSIEDPIVIVINGTADDTYRLTHSVTYVSPAYNIMPYTRGTAVDGSDWAVNPEFFEKAVTINKAVAVQATASGDVNFYGFIFNYNYQDTSRKTSKFNIKFENCVFDYASNSATTGFTLSNDVNKKHFDIEDTLTVKNSYFAGSAKTGFKLFGATNLPAHITLDGVYMNPDKVGTLHSATSVVNVRQDQYNTSFTIRNSNISGFALSKYNFNGNSKLITASESRSIVIENNIINGTASATDPIFTIHSTRYSSLKIKNNYISSNGAENPLPLYKEGNTTTSVATDVPLEAVITENVLNGIDSEIKFIVSTNSKYKDTLRETVFTLGYNYISTGFKANLEGVTGGKLCATAHGITPKNYYADYLKQELVLEDIIFNGAEASNGLFAIDEPTRKVYYIMNSGDATAVTFDLVNDEADVKWYADKDCTTPVDPATISYDGDGIEYFFRVEKQEGEGIIHGDVYTVQITRETAKYPFFITEFSDPVIKSSAVLCDVDSGYVTDGRLYATEWNGQMYTFIKGVNVFDTIDAATTYLRSAGVERPQFMLKDLNGAKEMVSAWNVTLPADYFTENYANSPVIKGEKIDGSDWAFNEGTGAGQFDPAKTIRVLDIAFPANGVGGEYNFYGFTITRSVADWSRLQYVPKIHITNCVFDITNWSAAHLFRADEYKYPTDAERQIQSELIVKDSYFKTNGTIGRLVSGTLASTFKLDGILFDGPMGANTNTVYMQQVTTKSVFAIENSCFRNYWMSGIFYNEGMWSSNYASNKTDKSFIVNNNTFVNSTLSSGGIVDGSFDWFNRAEFIGNKVYNATPVPLFNYRGGGNITGVNFTVIIKDNIVNAGDPTVALGNRTYTEESVITNNYVAKNFQSGEGVTYGGVGLNVTGATLEGKQVYYIDSAMTRTNGQIQPYSVSGQNVDYNASTKTATVTVAPGGSEFFTELAINGTYVYTIDPSSIIHNPYGNVITYSYGSRTETLGRQLSVFSATQIPLPIELDVSVTSPDGAETPETFKIIITDNGPGIASVVVAGSAIEYADGGYAVELDARENGEAFEIVPVIDGTTVTVKDGNTVLDSLVVDVNPGTTKTYTIILEYNGLKYSAAFVVTRRPAEYDELEVAIEAAREIDMSRWLPKFAINLENAIARYEAFDRTTATQVEVDELTQYINDTMNNFIERVEIDALVVSAGKYKNVDGRYCPDTYAALKDAIATVGDLIPEIETQQQYDDAIALINNAIAGLVKQQFVNYVYDGNATLYADGTETAKCELCYDTHTRTAVGSIRSDWVWDSEKQVWNYYVGGKIATNTLGRDSKGWCFVGEDGLMVYNKWVQWLDGWYYIGADGYAYTNMWYKDSVDWVYLDDTGRMVTEGWALDSKGWCYMGANGYVTYNSWVMDSQGWCYVGADGYSVSNTWMKDTVGWCYLGADGRMLTNSWVADSHGWCYVGADGRMVYDMWVPDSTGMCYIDVNGYWDGRTAKFN